ncbi:Uncharacterised protein [Anaerobiospirillum thomasii]|nr:Uncharacterised protein [Anaerobiospirillum thomasii]
MTVSVKHKDFSHLFSETQNAIIMCLLQNSGRRTFKQLQKDLNNPVDLENDLEDLYNRGYLDCSSANRWSVGQPLEIVAKRNNIKLPYKVVSELPPLNWQEVYDVLCERNPNTYYKLRNADLESTAQKFFDYYEAVGWCRKGQRIKNWYVCLDYALKNGWVIVYQRDERQVQHDTSPWAVTANNSFDGFF